VAGGRGAGDPDLLTRKAERLIRAADVVFFDALVGEGVLALAGAGAELVSVGKRSGRHSRAQGSINDLLVAAARAGRRVVRLKGATLDLWPQRRGDGGAGRRGVPFRICPGVTTASAAAAGALASLTLRGAARGITLVTAHLRAGEPLALDWAALASRRHAGHLHGPRGGARGGARPDRGGARPGNAGDGGGQCLAPDERLIRRQAFGAGLSGRGDQR
jgi:uroporphyrin-III C-methyltransferase